MLKSRSSPWALILIATSGLCLLPVPLLLNYEWSIYLLLSGILLLHVGLALINRLLLGSLIVALFLFLALYLRIKPMLVVCVVTYLVFLIMGMRAAFRAAYKD